MRMPLMRGVAVAVAAALALTACGGNDEPDEPAGGSAAAGEGFPRTVEHAMGSTEIPSRPERVVVLDTGELDTALSLGVTPVGAVTTAVSQDFLSYLADDAEGVEVVGTITEPNLEAIAGLEPDLILSSKMRHEELYDQLSQIAPTVFAERVGVTWKDNLRLDAEALGLEEEAETALEEFEADAAALGTELGDAAPSVSAVRFMRGAVRVYTTQSFIGTVLADIGLQQVEVPSTDNPTFAELSEEEITRADADVVLYSSYGAEGESQAAAVLAGPLWPRLGAVAEGNAHQVEDDIFYTGVGLRAATLQLEQLRELLG
jgi:iron complex transport system substrate-binding protein